MTGPKIKLIFRNKPTLEPNKILNEVFLKDNIIIEEIDIYSQAQPTTTSILVFIFVYRFTWL